MKATVFEIASNSPTALAGLKTGDEIIGMDGQKVYSYLAVFSAEDEMSNSPVKPLTLTVRRGDEQFDRTLLAAKPIQPTNSNPSLGIIVWGKTPTWRLFIRIRSNRFNPAPGRFSARSARCFPTRARSACNNLAAR